jgi:hypothetical protein
VNFDEQITIADFIDLASHFGQSPAGWGDGDTNNDGVVSIADFINLTILIGSDASVTSAPQPALFSALTSSSAPKHRRHKLHRARPPKFVLPQAHWLENR